MGRWFAASLRTRPGRSRFPRAARTEGAAGAVRQAVTASATRSPRRSLWPPAGGAADGRSVGVGQRGAGAELQTPHGAVELPRRGLSSAETGPAGGSVHRCSSATARVCPGYWGRMCSASSCGWGRAEQKSTPEAAAAYLRRGGRGARRHGQGIHEQ